MKKRQITIHDIARELSITASTVSRALNNHPRISENTKQKVREAAKKLQYRPNVVASNLRLGKGNTIGVIVPLINRHFFANIIHGIESVTHPAGYNIIICQSNENLEKEIENIKTLIHNRVNGILISISAETKDGNHFDEIIRSGIPLVQFDRINEEFNCSRVKNNNLESAYKSTKHLLDQGYRRIAHFSGPLYLAMYKERFAGYKKALEEYKVKLDENLIFEGVINRITGTEAMEKILASGLGVDAVFAAGDYGALGALLTARKRGIRVPDEMGFVGYVNEPFTEWITPSLTTNEQFGVELGKKAAALLLEEIQAEKKPQPKEIIVDPELIIRDSSLRSSKN